MVPGTCPKHKTIKLLVNVVYSAMQLLNAVKNDGKAINTMLHDCVSFTAAAATTCTVLHFMAED